MITNNILSLIYIKNKIIENPFNFITYIYYYIFLKMIVEIWNWSSIITSILFRLFYIKTTPKALHEVVYNGNCKK